MLIAIVREIMLIALAVNTLKVVRVYKLMRTQE